MKITATITKKRTATMTRTPTPKAPSRAARLLALAYHIDGLVESGAISKQVALRLVQEVAHTSAPRVQRTGSACAPMNPLRRATGDAVVIECCTFNTHSPGRSTRASVPG